MHNKCTTKERTKMSFISVVMKLMYSIFYLQYSISVKCFIELECFVLTFPHSNASLNRCEWINSFNIIYLHRQCHSLMKSIFIFLLLFQFVEEFLFDFSIKSGLKFSILILNCHIIRFITSFFTWLITNCVL